MQGNFDITLSWVDKEKLLLLEAYSQAWRSCAKINRRAFLGILVQVLVIEYAWSHAFGYPIVQILSDKFRVSSATVNLFDC
ncbi:hypothetical protein AKJ16_DCAP08210 [Drosera capensis]